mgnify:CR=1 FL=1
MTTFGARAVARWSRRCVAERRATTPASRHDRTRHDARKRARRETNSLLPGGMSRARPNRRDPGRRIVAADSSLPVFSATLRGSTWLRKAIAGRAPEVQKRTRRSPSATATTTTQRSPSATADSKVRTATMEVQTDLRPPRPCPLRNVMAARTRLFAFAMARITNKLSSCEQAAILGSLYARSGAARDMRETGPQSHSSACHGRDDACKPSIRTASRSPTSRDLETDLERGLSRPRPLAARAPRLTS